MWHSLPTLAGGLIDLLCNMRDSHRMRILVFDSQTGLFPSLPLAVESLGEYDLGEVSTGQVGYQQWRERAKNQLTTNWEFTAKSPDPNTENKSEC